MLLRLFRQLALKWYFIINIINIKTTKFLNKTPQLKLPWCDVTVTKLKACLLFFKFAFANKVSAQKPSFV
jgi:hypothetical protein